MLVKRYTQKQFEQAVGLYKERCSTLVELKEEVLKFLAGPGTEKVLIVVDNA